MYVPCKLANLLLIDFNRIFIKFPFFIDNYAIWKSYTHGLIYNNIDLVIIAQDAGHNTKRIDYWCSRQQSRIFFISIAYSFFKPIETYLYLKANSLKKTLQSALNIVAVDRM